MSELNQEYQRIFNTPIEKRILESRKDLPNDVLIAFGLNEPKVAFCSPLTSCEAKRCFVNVENQMSAMGGTMEVGWMFWEARDQCYHTEAHAIWIGPQGTPVDITPHGSIFQPRKILFSPDPLVAKKRGYTAAHRYITTSDRRVRMIEEYTLELDRIMERYFTGTFGVEMEIPTSEFKEAAERIGLPMDVAKWMADRARRGETIKPA